MTKVNDKCPCDSGFKYKKCCMNREIQEKNNLREKKNEGYRAGHEFSERTEKVRELLKQHVPDYESIDVTRMIANRQIVVEKYS
jgi:hypothetical protein